MNCISAGVDIGGTNTVAGLVDREGNILKETSFSTTDFKDPGIYISHLAAEINRMVGECGPDTRLVGIGIGGPNANFYSGNIEYAANIKWKGIVPVVRVVKKYFPHIPVIMTNDANAAAIGEMIYGGARGMTDFIVVTLGTGLGSGFVAGGKLIYGHDSFAGELGHVIVNRTGRVCGCGRKGCLETYASATGIKRTVFKLLADSNTDSCFRDITYNDLTAEMITKAALNGDPIAIDAFEITGKYLGQALADAVTITSPEAIFLFGGLARAGKYLLEPTRKYMEEHMLSIFHNKVKLLPSALPSSSAAVLGASALVWEQLKGTPVIQ